MLLYLKRIDSVVWFSILFLAVLSVGAYFVDQNRQSQKYRIFCLLPNGTSFYNGTASGVHSFKGGLRFTPDTGPQTGESVSTTFPCTWMQIK